MKYPPEHQAIRRAWAPVVAAGDVVCWRCGRPIAPGELWDLGHLDGQVGYGGPEHRGRCNRRHAAIRGNKLRAERRRAQRDERQERITRMLTTCAIGVEIAEDRGHTSIAAAGHMDGFVLVELAGYVDGADPTGEVLRLRAERKVSAVALDPRSPAATAVKPLKDAGVDVTEMSSHDVAVAHGEFLDLVAAGRLRHAGQAELTTAIRHGEQRRLGGATAWERRGAPVDVAPAVAAEIAVWALEHARPPQPFAIWR